MSAIATDKIELIEGLKKDLTEKLNIQLNPVVDSLIARLVNSLYTKSKPSKSRFSFNSSNKNEQIIPKTKANSLLSGFDFNSATTPLESFTPKPVSSSASGSNKAPIVSKQINNAATATKPLEPATTVPKLVNNSVATAFAGKPSLEPEVTNKFLKNAILKAQKAIELEKNLGEIPTYTQPKVNLPKSVPKNVSSIANQVATPMASEFGSIKDSFLQKRGILPSGFKTLQKIVDFDLKDQPIDDFKFNLKQNSNKNSANNNSTNNFLKKISNNLSAQDSNEQSNSSTKIFDKKISSLVSLFKRNNKEPKKENGLTFTSINNENKENIVKPSFVVKPNSLLKADSNSSSATAFSNAPSENSIKQPNKPSKNLIENLLKPLIDTFKLFQTTATSQRSNVNVAPTSTSDRSKNNSKKEPLTPTAIFKNEIETSKKNDFQKNEVPQISQKTSNKEIVKEAPKEKVEVPKETVKEVEKIKTPDQTSVLTASPKETIKEVLKDTLREASKETFKETVKEAPKEKVEAPKETVKEVEKIKTPDQTSILTASPKEKAEAPKETVKEAPKEKAEAPKETVKEAPKEKAEAPKETVKEVEKIKTPEQTSILTASPKEKVEVPKETVKEVEKIKTPDQTSILTASPKEKAEAPKEVAAQENLKEKTEFPVPKQTEQVKLLQETQKLKELTQNNNSVFSILEKQIPSQQKDNTNKDSISPKKGVFDGFLNMLKPLFGTGKLPESKQTASSKSNLSVSADSKPEKKSLLEAEKEPTPFLFAGFTDKGLSDMKDKLPDILKPLLEKLSGSVTVNQKGDSGLGLGPGIIKGALQMLAGIGGLLVSLHGMFTSEWYKGLEKLIGRGLMDFSGFTKRVDKFIGKFVSNLIKIPTRIIGNFGKTIMGMFGKEAGKAAIKTGLGASKSFIPKLIGNVLKFVKKIPFVGSLISIGFAWDRFNKGDYVGGGLEVLSGVANVFGLVPLSWAIDGLNAFLDFKAGGIGEGKKGKGAIITDWVKSFGSWAWENIQKLPILGPLIKGVKNIFSGNFQEGLKELAKATPIGALVDFLAHTETGQALGEKAKGMLGSMGSFIKDIKDKALRKILEFLPETILGISVRSRVANMLGIDMGPITDEPTGPAVDVQNATKPSPEATTKTTPRTRGEAAAARDQKPVTPVADAQIDPSGGLIVSSAKEGALYQLSKNDSIIAAPKQQNANPQLEAARASTGKMESILEKIANNTGATNSNIANLITGFNSMAKALKTVGEAVGEKINIPPVIVNQAREQPTVRATEYAKMGNSEISEARNLFESLRPQPT